MHILFTWCITGVQARRHAAHARARWSVYIGARRTSWRCFIIIGCD